jgi:hypothetical protein
MQFALGFIFAMWIVLICMILLQEDPQHEDDEI